MKNILLVLIISVVTPIVYGEDKSLRYDNFVFTPSYQAGSDNIKEILEKQLSEFHYIEKLIAANIGDSSLGLYRVNVKKDRREDYNKKLSYKEFVLKQKFDESDWTTWDAISYISSLGRAKLILKSTAYNDFFAVKGYRDYDYYGCIDTKPVYTAPLIEGQPDFFFVITATQGSPIDPLVSDYMSFSIISSRGDLQLTEKLFWANYYPAPEGPIVHFYGESSNKQELEELPINDGHGRKRYAKIFISDLEQDNQLDILFWFKTFKSTDFNEKRGFRFEKEFFKHYRENASRGGFEEKPIDSQTATLLLESNLLTWEDGYPQSTFLCEGGQFSEFPLMMQIVD